MGVVITGLVMVVEALPCEFRSRGVMITGLVMVVEALPCEFRSRGDDHRVDYVR